MHVALHVVADTRRRAAPVRCTAMNLSSQPLDSAAYWRGIFTRHPGFCSWQTPRQAAVRAAIESTLSRLPRPARVLDFGVGNLGLYHALAPELLDGLSLTGVSESAQHDPHDPLLARMRGKVLVTPQSLPLALPTASVDLALATYVLAYLDEARRRQLLLEFARVIAPGGRLLLALHHPESRRHDSFRRSAPFWQHAERAYVGLLAGDYDAAARHTSAAEAHVQDGFHDDPQHARYLRSHLRTAARFLEYFVREGLLTALPPSVAIDDCRDTLGRITRERAMTTDGFAPVLEPERLPGLRPRFRLHSCQTCVAPDERGPLAHVLVAIRTGA